MKEGKTNPLEGSGDSDTDWLIDPEGPCDPSELVKLSGIVSSRDGVAAEREWTEEHFPGFRWTKQRTRQNKHGQQVDEITLTGADGTEVKVYFDITAWFGKPSDTKGGQRLPHLPDKLRANVEAVHDQLEKDVNAGDPKAGEFEKLVKTFRKRP
ncbi:MAG: hypothetical protein QOF93_947, partial [Verrucomicrobiota bacterium]|jgi:hypothetical protein